MNKKHFFLGMVSGASMVLAAAAVVFLCGTGILMRYLPSIGPGAPAETAEAGDSGSLDLNAVEKKLEEIGKNIDSYYLDEIDGQALEDGIYAGLLDSLGDKYAHYYSLAEVEELMFNTTGTFEGIGVVVGQDAETNYIYVLYVYYDSPARRAGMAEGDIIIGVNGQDVLGTDLNEVVSLIRGESGTEVTVKVRRGSEELELTMERGPIVADTVAFEMAEEHIGYIRLVQFETASVGQMKNAIQQLKEQGMQKMILDLRSNPGGVVDGVVAIADMFIDNNVVLYEEDKNGERQYFSTDPGVIFEGPIVVLVDENTASAAEVLSAALQDYGLATILGTTTFGKGIVQSLLPLSDGTLIKFTTAHYYTPNGRDIHGVGVTPDVVLEFDSSGEGDNQLLAALELLREQ